MIDGNAPTNHPLARYGMWGHPFHGKVSGGQLELPNGTSIAYPQPAGETPEQYGSARALIVPGVPEVARTPEQAAADTAAGYAWRNVATLSGGRNQLWGKPLDGWIYIDPAGERWLVRYPAGWDSTEHDLSTPLSLTFRLSRFGVIGGDPEHYDYPVTLTDWQQSGDPITWYPVDSSDGAAPLTTAKLCLDGLQPDGSAAAIMICKRRGSLAPSPIGRRPNVDCCIRHPLGWLELTISGAGRSATVSLSVLRSRAQTLHHDVSSIAIPGQVGAIYEDSDYQWVASVTPDTPADLSLDRGHYVWSVAPGSYSTQVFFVRRLLSMAPLQQGGWAEVALEIDSQSSVVNTAEVAGATALSSSGLRTSTAMLSLTVAGVAQVQIEVEQVRNSSGDVWVEDLVVGHTIRGTGSVNQTLTVDGEVVMTYADSWDTDVLPLPLPTEQHQSAIGPLYHSAISSARDELCFYAGFGDVHNVQIFSPYATLHDAGDAGHFRFIDTVRLSTQMLCLRIREFTQFDSGVGSAPGADYTYTAAVTPAGVRGPDRTVQAYDANAQRFGSICPHTGEAVLLTGVACYV